METLINECVQWRSTTISKLDYTEWEWEKNSKSEQRWPNRTIQYQRKRHKQKQYDRGIVASTRKIAVLPNKAKSMCMSIVIAWLLACLSCTKRAFVCVVVSLFSLLFCKWVSDDDNDFMYTVYVRTKAKADWRKTDRKKERNAKITKLRWRECQHRRQEQGVPIE